MDSTTGFESLANMLVVDDEERNRKLLEGYLRSEGYRVRSAPDGPTALMMAREQAPDLVLLDVMMPFMTGYEVCQILKAEPYTRLCQIMMVTALDGTPDKVEGLDTGADDYVTKPVRREEFLAKVRALLRAHRLLVDLEQARAELAARNQELQLKKTLAETLVHDLKNPLGGILGNLDLMELRGGKDVDHLIARSQRGAARMLSMILDLLDVEKMEQGRLEPHLDRVDIINVAREAVDEASSAARLSKIELSLEAQDESWAEADPGLLRRVFDNLLSNAVSHSPRDTTVRLSVHPRPEGIEVAVADRGNGVPQELRESVFDKYSQVDKSRLTGAANRGLGLTFCRLAVEAQGGTIWVDDAPEGGACFRIILPDATSPTTSPAESPAAVEI